MSNLFQNYKRDAIEFVKADGNYLFDQAGNAYLDFSSGIGVTNLGFHPAIKNAVKNQLEKIWHTPNLYQNSLQEEVAELLIGQRDYLAFFCNSGAESNEAAIKLARKATGKSDIICFKQSFHGRTYAAMSATGQEKIQIGFAPLVPGFSYADYNDLESVKDLVGPQTAAIMLELVQGEGGVTPADKDFIGQLAALCQTAGILLIVDEVQTGIGRTG
ncbi:TPA: aminotransferase class III-fold pyridoxal phosphate-dependent enzyme, partial [Streptococcus suis]